VRALAVYRPLVALLLVVAGCVSHPTQRAPVDQSAPKNTDSKTTAPPALAARYNLTGYSDAFKHGFADACAKRQDKQRYKADMDYQMGWSDGGSMCERR
jgi:hypothetical protein